MTPYKLFGSPLSSYTRAVLVALNEKRLKYEFAVIGPADRPDVLI
ncbi:MAG: glutathione S-transferase N-terminal domain-containing protein [Pseudomonadota bacterium]